jgi:hypothetical protein
MNDLYLVLNDSNWCYQKPWAQFFKPFWDEEQKQKFLSSRLDRTVIDLNVGDENNFGLKYWFVPEINEKCQDIIPRIMVPNDCIQEKIENAARDFADMDVSFQVRTGYENKRERYSLVDHVEKITQVIVERGLPNQRMFILADTYDAVTAFQEIFPNRVYSLCPASYTGFAKDIRNSENLELALTEISVAKNAKHHIGRARGLSELINVVRKRHNCYLI